MKVGSREQELLQDAVKVSTRSTAVAPEQARAERSALKGQPSVETGLQRALDKVSLKWSTAVEEMVNPESSDPARRARIDELRRAIQSKTYNPPADAVARKVGEESILELLMVPQGDEL